MLPAEFYLLNATTLLLWLFQTCPHEVLLLVILLGVLFTVVSICIFTFSIVKYSFSIALALVSIALRRCIFRSIAHSTTFSSMGNPPITSNTLIDRILSDHSSDTSPSTTQRRGLSLPRYLALHPTQWSAVEAAIHPPLPAPEPSAPPSPRDTLVQHASSAPSVPSPPLRRSTRRRRVRNCCSS